MSNNLFGTDGIRALVGTGPLQQQELAHLGKAIGIWLTQQYGRKNSLLIAHDTRISCSFIKASLKSGLLLTPLHIQDAGVLPTPAVYQLVAQQQLFDAGIIISASHNPFYDNGIKIITRDGKLNALQEEEISTLITKPLGGAINYHEDLGHDEPVHHLADFYCTYIQKFFEQHFLQGIKIVLDCAHGAAYTIAPALLQQFGADVVVIHNSPNGININHQSGSTAPAVLQQAVLSNQADIGFAFDGDADRIIVVNRYGEIKDGDDILALLATHAQYAEQDTIVATLMSNHGLAVHLEQRNKKIIRTAVGDKYVAQMLAQQKLLLGGEPSGHIIAADYMLCSDALFIALRILQAMQLHKNWDMNTFTKMPQAILNIKVQEKKNLTEEPFASIIAHYTASLQPGRLVIRYSGTEALLRIMAEAEQLSTAQAIIEELAQKLLPLLTNKGIYYETKEKPLVPHS